MFNYLNVKGIGVFVGLALFGFTYTAQAADSSLCVALKEVETSAAKTSLQSQRNLAAGLQKDGSGAPFYWAIDAIGPSRCRIVQDKARASYQCFVGFKSGDKRLRPMFETMVKEIPTCLGARLKKQDVKRFGDQQKIGTGGAFSKPLPPGQLGSGDFVLTDNVKLLVIAGRKDVCDLKKATSCKPSFGIGFSISVDK